jgi:hypothetical protein
MSRAFAGSLAVVALAVAPASAGAQVSATGNFTAYGEAYQHSGSGTPARPVNTGRITANLTLSLFHGLVSAPLTALISTDQVSFRQQINQIGVSPTYKTVTFHAGWFNPAYSAYTIADATVLGGGIDVAQGRWRVGGLYGRARKAVTPATGVTAQAQWNRWMTGGHLGYGDLQRTFLDAFVVRTQDRPGGIDTTGVTFVPPVEATTVAGAKGQLAFADNRLQLQFEAASSQYTRQDTVAFQTVTAPAAAAKLLYNGPTWTFGTTAEYIGPGFTTLGNSGLSGDRLDLGLTGSAQVQGGRLSLRGMGGWRRNNLKDDLAATTTQAIYNFGGSWQPSPTFGVDWQLANNVNNNKAKDDTSSIKNITGVYSVTPRLLWRTGAVQHVLVVVGGVQRSQNTSPLSVALLDTKTTLLVGTWSATFPSSFTLTTTATYTRVELDTLGKTTIATVAPGFSYALFARKLQVQAQAQWMRATNPGSQTENEVFPLAQLGYAVAAGQVVTVKSSIRHHEFSNTGSFDERIVSLQYSASLR